MNIQILVGNLGKDPETFNGGSTPVTSFSVATEDGWGDNKKTNWHNVKTFGKTAELCGQYLAKGRKVAIRGRSNNYEYTDKDGNKRYGHEIIADNVEFLSSGKGEETVQDKWDSTKAVSQVSSANDLQPSLDDIPF